MTSAALVILYLKLSQQAATVRKAVLFQTERLTKIDEAIEDIVDLVIGIVDIASINANNEKRLALRIKECFLPKDQSSLSLLNKLPALANIYRFGIIDHLKKVVPTLSSAEIEFLSLIVLGASPSAISIACGYDHPATLYNKRLKLRKKLDIQSSDTDLEEYIMRVAGELKKRHDEGINALRKANYIK